MICQNHSVANKAKIKVLKARTCFLLADFNAKFSLFRPKVLDEIHFEWLEKTKYQRNSATMMTQFPTSITLNLFYFEPLKMDLVLETTFIAIYPISPKIRNSSSVFSERKKRKSYQKLSWHRLTSRRYKLQHKRLSQQFFHQIKEWFYQWSILGQALNDEVIIFNSKISVWHNKT